MGTLVVIPTYNEMATIDRVVEGVLAGRRVIDVLVVDDGSPDGTGSHLDGSYRSEPRVHVMHRPAKRGLGTAYRDGFTWGLDRSYDVLCEMDADLSHDPAALPSLVEATAHADLAIGSRYVPGGSVVNWPLRRELLSRAGNLYARLMCGLPARDATSGFRAFRGPVLRAIDLASIRSDGYAFQIETTLRASRAGFRIMEIPIVFTERTDGESKMDRSIVLEAIARVTLWARPRGRGPHAVHPDSVAAVGPSTPF